MQAIIAIEAIFLILVWFVSDIARSSCLDRFFLYYVDDIFRYCHIKALPFNPATFFNYYCKAGYTLIAEIFYNILPFGMSSLRIMNTLFSCGILFLVYKLTRIFSFSKLASNITILLLVTFPVFFLLSITTLSEVMYSFFITLFIYFLCRQKNKLAVFVVALLPLIRQEGILYIFTWIFLFRKQLKIKHIVFVFLPTIIWIISNRVLFGHGFERFFFYLPAKDPGNSMISPQGFAGLMGILFLHPLIILSMAGAWFSLRDKNLRFLKAFFLAQGSFFVIFQLLHFFDSGGFFCRELRIIMPLFPLAALYSGRSVDIWLKKYNFTGNWALVFITAFLMLIMMFQIGRLQRDPTVIADSMSSREEIALKDASGWLNIYMQQKKIDALCVVPGSVITDKVIRRVWMYLPGKIDFYAEGNEEKDILDNEVFDFATLRPVRLDKDKESIYISTKKLEIDSGLSFPVINLIKEFPEIRLYCYSVTHK